MSNPILIVGAGPVGLTMAAALTHHGLNCRIIDKNPSPSDKSKALAVWCRTLELLNGLGLADKFVLSGMKLTGGSMYANGERLVHLILASDESRFGFPLMIPQNITEQLLSEHLKSNSVKIERQVELVSFVEASDSIQCALKHADGSEESIDTPYVIGCDGAHSTVRHATGLEFTGYAEPNDWMLADVHIDGDAAKDEVSVFWHDQGVLALFPMGNSRFRIIADCGTASDQPLPPEITLAEVQDVVKRRGPKGLQLSDPIWLSYFRINERKVSDYRKGRVMLAGDAAHIHSPAGGQGMNTGMQDAFNLAWKLTLVVKGQGQFEPLLNSYSVERSTVGDQVLKNAERFTTLATLRHPIAQWLRNHIAPILGSLTMVQDKIRNDWFELSINYRHSPLSRQNTSEVRSELAAGDRLFDARLRSTQNGHITNLFSEVSSTRHTVLLLPSTKESSASQLFQIYVDATRAFPDVLTVLVIQKESHAKLPNNAEMPAWIDFDDNLHKKLNASEPTLVIVRPDGYIGLLCENPDKKQIIDYLDSYLVRKD